MGRRELDLGWRGRPITLAVLGAAALVRAAFGPGRIGPRTPLEMEVLAYLTLGTGVDRAMVEPGEAPESMRRALACDGGDLDESIYALTRDGLVGHPTETDADQVAITPAGLARVEEWLGRTVSLFAGWPPDHPNVDDVTG